MKNELFIRRVANGWIINPPLEYPNCAPNFSEVFVYNNIPDLLRGIDELLTDFPKGSEPQIYF